MASNQISNWCCLQLFKCNTNNIYNINKFIPIFMHCKKVFTDPTQKVMWGIVITSVICLVVRKCLYLNILWKYRRKWKNLAIPKETRGLKVPNMVLSAFLYDWVQEEALFDLLFSYHAIPRFDLYFPLHSYEKFLSEVL